MRPDLERTDESIRTQAFGVEDLELNQFIKKLRRRDMEVEEEWLVPVRRVCGLLHARLLRLVVHRHTGHWLDVGTLELPGLNHFYPYLKAQVAIIR